LRVVPLTLNPDIYAYIYRHPIATAVGKRVVVASLSPSAIHTHTYTSIVYYTKIVLCVRHALYAYIYTLYAYISGHPIAAAVSKCVVVASLSPSATAADANSNSAATPATAVGVATDRSAHGLASACDYNIINVSNVSYGI